MYFAKTLARTSPVCVWGFGLMLGRIDRYWPPYLRVVRVDNGAMRRTGKDMHVNLNSPVLGVANVVEYIHYATVDTRLIAAE